MIKYILWIKNHKIICNYKPKNLWNIFNKQNNDKFIFTLYLPRLLKFWQNPVASTQADFFIRKSSRKQSFQVLTCIEFPYNFPLRSEKIIISNLGENSFSKKKRFEEHDFFYLKQSGKNIRIVWAENTNFNILRNLYLLLHHYQSRSFYIYLNALTKQSIKETVPRILKLQMGRGI